MVFCLIPGIYLSPIFALVPAIMVMENTSFGYAFNQSFRLIKDNWWVTFGVMFVVYIILYVLNLSVSIPLMILGAGNVFLHLNRWQGLVITYCHYLPPYFSLSQYVSHILMVVAVGLCYFNLTESKEGTGLMERINQFGSTETDPTCTAEEY